MSASSPATLRRGLLALLAVVALVLVTRSLLRTSGADAPDGDVLRGTAHREALDFPGLAASHGESEPIAPAVAAGDVAQPSAAPEASLRVHVTWAADGTPASDVGLRVIFWDGPQPRREGRLVRTDAQGEWFAPSVPPGRVTAYSDRSASASREIVPGEAATLDLVLPAASLVRGVVTDPDARAVTGAEIWLSAPGNASEGQVVARSDGQGRFELRDVRVTGRYVGARARDRGPSGLVALDGDGARPGDVVLVLGDESGSVRGQVLTPDGAPVGGAVVRLGTPFGFKAPPHPQGLKLRGPAPFVHLTEADGRFEFVGVPAGRHAIVAVAPGHSPATFPTLPSGVPIDPTGALLIEAGRLTDVVLRLQAAASLAGTVRNEAGAPVAGATVRTGAWTDLLGSEATTGADGRYELRGIALPPGPFEASHVTAGRARAILAIGPGEQATWDPVLSAGAGITGTLLDAHGAPAPGFVVESRPLDGSDQIRRQTRSERDGRFELWGVGTGPQALVASGSVLGNAEVLLASPVEPGSRDLKLSLPDGLDLPAEVVGRLLDASGVPGPPALVRVSNTETGQGWIAEVDPSSGRFRAAPLAPGAYRIEVQPDEAPWLEVGPIQVAGGQSVDAGDLVLRHGGRIVLTLDTDDGAPVGQISVVAIGLDGSSGGTLKQEGRDWRSKSLRPGRYVLSLQSMQHATARLDVEVEDGRDTLLHHVLRAGVTVMLRVFAPPVPLDRTTPFSLAVRSADGTLVIDMPGAQLPARQAAVADDVPLLMLPLRLDPGWYLVDVRLGGSGVLGRDLLAAADATWDFDFR